MNWPFVFGILVGIGITMLVSVLCTVVMVRAANRRPAEDAPRPFDPDNLPRHVVNVRGIGEPEATCTCHDRPLKDGETFLLWPLQPERLCKETYETASSR